MYGFVVGSGERTSNLFSSPFVDGILISCVRFSFAHPMVEGAFPAPSLIYQSDVGLRKTVISLMWERTPAIKFSNTSFPSSDLTETLMWNPFPQ